MRETDDVTNEKTSSRISEWVFTASGSPKTCLRSEWPRMTHWQPLSLIIAGLHTYTCVILVPRTNTKMLSRWSFTNKGPVLPWVLWRCWLGGRKGTLPVKTQWWDAGMVSVWGEVQICTSPSLCHCHSLSLASVNPDWFYQNDSAFLVPA